MYRVFIASTINIWLRRAGKYLDGNSGVLLVEI